MRSVNCKPKNNIAADVFADYRTRYEQGLPIKNPQILLDQFTDKQRNFIREYLKDLNATRAVKAAGYNTKYPNRIATQLLHNPKIRLAIDVLQLERAKRSVAITSDTVLKKIMKIVEASEDGENPGEKQVALRGLELIARHLGMFIERQEISGKNGEAIQYQKVEEDAGEFTRSIASLAERAGTGGIPLKVIPGGKS